jgi:hypothetical protein
MRKQPIDILCRLKTKPHVPATFASWCLVELETETHLHLCGQHMDSRPLVRREVSRMRTRR